MELKIGNIYKITAIKHEKEVNVTGILIEKMQPFGTIQPFRFITTKGTVEQVDSQQIVKITATKLKEEVRIALKALYKQYQEKEKIQMKVKALQKELYEKSDAFRTNCRAIKELSGEYTLYDVAQQFKDMQQFREDDVEPTFGFYLTKYVTKYADPRQFPFLDTEYDGQLYIRDYDACYKNFGFSLSASELDALKITLKHTTLETVVDDAQIGDKNSLIIEKVLHFKRKKGVSYPEILQECAHIQQWVEQQKQKISSMTY